MGRKKKRSTKPWCWYCNREFEDEKILIQHQKAKHFKCHICGKKLFTGPGLAIHCMQVHKETIDKIPGAISGRDSTEIEVYGMEGIPSQGDDEPKSKHSRNIIPPPTAVPTISGFPPQPGGGMAPFNMVMPPFIPPFPMCMMPPVGVPLPNNSMIPPSIPMPIMPPQQQQTTSHPKPPLQQPAATFPAYQGKKSNPLPDTKPTLINSSALPHIKNSDLSTSRLLGSRTRIVCPEENVSLEERMAERFGNGARRPSLFR